MRSEFVAPGSVLDPPRKTGNLELQEIELRKVTVSIFFLGLIFAPGTVRLCSPEAHTKQSFLTWC